MQPYERLAGMNLIAGVMTAHIVYPNIETTPASFSKVWIQRELRDRIGFGGAVFSDDLSMKATGDYGSMVERARLALDAGSDMVLVCNDRNAAQKTVNALSEYSNPLSLVRLARLHGTRQTLRETLLASDEWAEAVNALADWREPPELELNA